MLGRHQAHSRYASCACIYTYHSMYACCHADEAIEHDMWLIVCMYACMYARLRTPRFKQLPLTPDCNLQACVTSCGSYGSSTWCMLDNADWVHAMWKPTSSAGVCRMMLVGRYSNIHCNSSSCAPQCLALDIELDTVSAAVKQPPVLSRLQYTRYPTLRPVQHTCQDT